jgi:hypothetical protein
MIRRSVAAALGALSVFALCLCADFLYRAHVVGHVDGTSLWSALTNRPRTVLTAWQLSMRKVDWVLYAGAGLAAGGLILGGPFLIRFATSRRGTE